MGFGVEKLAGWDHVFLQMANPAFNMSYDIRFEPIEYGFQGSAIPIYIDGSVGQTC